DYQDDEIFCQNTSINFIDSLAQLFGAWVRGYPAILVPAEVVKDPFELVQLLATGGVTRLLLVPSLLRSLLDAESRIRAVLHRLPSGVASGEPLPASLAHRFYRMLPSAQLVNLYGATEAWDATFYLVPPDFRGSTVPIGAPLRGVTVRVLDAKGSEVPLAEEG